MSESATERPANSDPLQNTPAAAAAAPPHLPDFEVLKRIGQGTFGAVWLAKERVTGVYRAVKVIPAALPDAEIAGLCEYQRRALSHPHLLQVHLVGRQAQYYYVVMELADDIKGTVALDPEYYEPCNLDRLLKDRGAMKPSVALAHVADMLEAVDYLHHQGLVHRDIKPANVLFVSGNAKLCDFGLIAPGHQAVDRAGTHGYWRPDGPTDRDSDLYAMTKVAYQMLSGTQITNFPELPADLARLTSAEQYRRLKEFLMRGCSNQASRRFSSAQIMLSHIKALQEPHPGSHGGPGTNGTHRRLQRAGVPALMVVTLALLAVFGWQRVIAPTANTFAPLAEMNVVAYPDGAGNPNSLSHDDPEGLLRRGTRVFSTSNPEVPEWPVAYARIQLVSKPPSYMLVFWISPSGYVYMISSNEALRTLHDPGLQAFRSLDGRDDNYIICGFMNDRPFNKDGLRAAIERLVRRYRAEHPDQKALPAGVMRLLNAGGVKLAYRREAEPDDDLRSDFGLLGEIWLQYGNSYPIVGFELPLPAGHTLP